jgi:hypothetical protein
MLGWTLGAKDYLDRVCLGLDGRLKTLGHQSLHAGIVDMGMVESLHRIASHWIIDDLNRRFAEPAAVAASAR